MLRLFWVNFDGINFCGSWKILLRALAVGINEILLGFFDVIIIICIKIDVDAILGPIRYTFRIINVSQLP